MYQDCRYLVWSIRRIRRIQWISVFKNSQKTIRDSERVTPESHSEEKDRRNILGSQKRGAKSVSKIKKDNGKADTLLSHAAREEKRIAKFMKKASKSVTDSRADDPLVRKIVKKEVRGNVLKHVQKSKDKYKDKKFDDIFGDVDEKDSPDPDDTGLNYYEFLVKEEKMKKDELVLASEARSIVKKAIKQVYAPVLKQRDIDISRARDQKGLLDYVPEEKVITAKPKVKTTRGVKQEFTKEQKQQLRDANTRHKVAKRQRKKERQAERKINSIDDLLAECGEEYDKRFLFGLLPRDLVLEFVAPYLENWEYCTSVDAQLWTEASDEKESKGHIRVDDFPRFEIGGKEYNFSEIGGPTAFYAARSTVLNWEKDTNILQDIDYYIHPIIIVCKAEDSRVFASGLSILLERLGLGLSVLERNFYSSIAMTLHKRIYAKRKEVDLKTEGGLTEGLDKMASTLQSGADFGGSLMNSEFYKTVRSALLTMVALHCLPKEYADQAVSFFGKSPSGASMQQLVVSLLTATSSLLKMGSRISKGENALSVLTGEDPYYKTLNELRTLHSNKDFLYSMNPVAGKMDDVSWCGRVIDCVEHATRISKTFGPLTVERKELDRLIHDVVSKYDEISILKNSTTRVAPLLFVIHGSPGIGKSKLVDLTFSACAESLGRDYRQKMIFHRNFNAKHWDGYIPSVQPYIHYSEVGNKLSSIMSSRGDPAVEEFLSVIDSQPYPAPMAKLEDKGKVFIRPEVVVIDSNTGDLGVKHIYRNTAAFDRRKIEIVPKVKPEYADPSGQIDPRKCLNSETPFFDRWTFDVFTYKAKNNTESVRTQHLDQGDVYALCTWIRNKYLEHLENESKAKSIMDDPNTYKGYFIPDPVPIHNKVVFPEETYTLVGAHVTHQDNKYEEKSMPVTEAGDEMTIKRFIDNRKSAVVETFFGISSRLLLLCDSTVKFGFMHLFEYLHLNQRNLVALLLFVFCLFTLLFRFIWGNPLISAMILYIIWNMRENFFEESINEVRAKKQAHKDFMNFRFLTLKRYLGYSVQVDGAIADFKSLISANKLEILCVGAIAAGTSYAAYKYLYSDKLETEDSTDFVNASPMNNILNDYEEKMGCGSSYERIPSKDNTFWNVKHPICTNTHTSGIEGLSSTVKHNVREVILTSPAETMWRSHILGVQGNVAVCNTHILRDYDYVDVKISMAPAHAQHDQYISLRLRKEDRLDVGNDVTFFHVGAIQFRDISNHFYKGTDFARSVPGMIGATSVTSILTGETRAANGNSTIVLEKTYQYNWPGHAGGFCGTPLLGQFGNRSFILGIHFAGSKSNSSCNATILSFDTVQDGINKLNNSIGLMEIYSHIDTKLSLDRSTSLATESQLESPVPKSPLHYVKLNNSVYYGKVPGLVLLNNKSNVKKSFLNDASTDEAFYEIYSHVRKTTFGPPPMRSFVKNGKYYDPFNNLLNKFEQEKPTLDKKILKKVVDRLVDKICENLESKGVVLEDIRPIKMETAINGTYKDAYLRKVSMSKSAGFDYPGTKREHVEEVKDFYYEVGDKLKKDIAGVFLDYEKRKTTGFVHNALLKDEARDVLKNDVGKTRPFFPAPFPALVISRMLLAPFYTLMVEHSDCFYTSIGIDMHKEGHKIWEVMIWGNIGAGDYGSFDQTMPFDIAWAAATVVYLILKRCGYNEHALKMVKGLLSDGLFPLVLINKDLFEMAGLQCSGKYATAEDNSLKGLILRMYCWYYLKSTRDYDFFEYNVTRTYGDDLLSDVHDRFKEVFNDIVYASFCKQHYGMTYTNTDKGEVNVKFINKKDMTFLKRSFTYNDILKRIVAPLDMDSIMKTLMWRIPSGSVSETEQVVSIISASMYELWLHSSEDQFRKIREYILKRFSSHYECDMAFLESTIPNFHQLTNHFMNGTNAMAVSAEELPSTDDLVTFVRPYEECDTASAGDGFIAISPGLTKRLDQLYGDNQRSSANNLQELRVQLQTELESIKEAEEVKGVSSDTRKMELETTLLVIRKLLAKKYGLKVESSPEIDMKTGEITNSKMSTHVNVMDVGGNEPAHADLDEGMYQFLEDSNLSVSDFMTRPIQILSEEIPMDTDYSRTLNVWDLLLKAPSIRAKYKNQAYMRAKINTRISISGSPFHMGKVQSTYIPFADHNDIYNRYKSDSSFRYGMLQYFSHMESTRVIDVKCNEPLEQCFDFVSPNTMIRLFNGSSTVIGSATSLVDAESLGKLEINTLNRVDSVSGGTSTPVYIYVYAWLSDVKLGCPTATMLELATESSEESFVGPLSGALSGAAKAAAMFQAVPVLNKYALASSNTLKGAAELAAAFGFSRPTIDTMPVRMKNEPFQNGANTIAADTDQKISLDPRQETLLNSGGSSKEDIMSFGYLCKRQHLIKTVTVPVDIGPNDGPIISLGINPALLSPYKSTLTRQYFQPGPMGMIARMFNSWSGKIYIRAEIVVSDFHRMKLAFAFDPNACQYTLVSSNIDLNKQHIFILDIQDSQDVTFCIDMASYKEWLRVLEPGNQQKRFDSTIGSDLIIAQTFLNGMMNVYALTKLQSPDQSKPAYINFYMWSDDMHFNGFKDMFPRDALMSDLAVESSNEIPNTCIELNQARKKDGMHSMRHFGEEPVSLRSLMKRFVTVREDVFNMSGSDVRLADKSPFYPEVFPRVNAVVPYGYYPSTWSHFCQCYVGEHGGVKYRWIYVGVSTEEMQWIRVALSAASDNTIARLFTSENTYNIRSTTEGSIFFSPTTNAGIEFALPFYDTNLFVFSQLENPWDDFPVLERNRISNFEVDANIKPAVRSGLRGIQFSIGEDFNFVHFVGALPYTTSL